MEQLQEIIALQERARNRLYDEFWKEVYLACQKELNRMAADNSLDISAQLIEPTNGNRAIPQ